MTTNLSVRDPVCGLQFVHNPNRGWDFIFGDVWYYFCGSKCRYEFRADPEHFLRPSFIRKLASSATPEPPTPHRSFWKRLLGRGG